MRIEDFDYHLPPERIAQHPSPERDGARMLLLDRRSGAVEDAWFRELPQRLRAGDLAVFNDSRVIPARLYGRRAGMRAYPPPGPHNPARKDFLARRVEVVLTRRLDERTWEALVRPGRKLPVGERIYFGGESGDAGAGARLEAEITGRGAFGERRLRFDWQGDFFALLDRLGRLPLPPYIHRPAAEAETAEDRERYQTVYAREPGSAAAPTAGLHFTPEILRRLDERGIERTAITLEVGLGTFQPVRAAEIEAHVMHTERFAIANEAAAAVNRARREGRRVVAIGTTVARALEARYAADAGTAPEGEFTAGEGETDLFLYPGKELRVVNALLTNFHAPRSTLLMLVAAFAGREAVLAAYRHAVGAGYRFLSYGDCMLIG